MTFRVGNASEALGAQDIPNPLTDPPLLCCECHVGGAVGNISAPMDTR